MSLDDDRVIIDSLGRTKVIPSPAKRLARRLTSSASGCHEWQGHRNPWGYGQIGVDGALKLTHRLAWEIANGPITEGLLVCHRCDNPPCCNPMHLFLGTHEDNAVDMVTKGRGVSPKGIGNGRAKLTDDAITQIRALSRLGLMNKEIAAMYGVHPTYVSRIVRGLRRAA